MKIAVVSDSHDRLDHLQQVVEIANQQNCQYLFHLGDMVAPLTALTLNNFRGKVVGVYGNCDGEILGLQKAFSSFSGELKKAPSLLTLEDKKIILMHEPILLDEIIQANSVDYVFYGHLHKIDQRQLNRVHILNPGEAAGLVAPPSFFVVDILSAVFTRFDL